MEWKAKMCVASLTLVAAGCIEHDVSTAPLVFLQTQTFGASVTAAPVDGAPSITVGYKDFNIAVVPTVVPEETIAAAPLIGVGNSNSTKHKLVSFGTVDDGQVDAYSTFGSFESGAKAGGVTLGKFFATGTAAQLLAQTVKDTPNPPAEEASKVECVATGTEAQKAACPKGSVALIQEAEVKIASETAALAQVREKMKAVEEAEAKLKAALAGLPRAE